MQKSQSLYKFVKYIHSDGLINIDYQDWLSCLACNGSFSIGMGKASGNHKGRIAVSDALDDIYSEYSADIKPSSIIYMIIFRSNNDANMEDICDIGKQIRNSNLGGNDLNESIIFGVYYDNQLEDDICVLVFVTGI